MTHFRVEAFELFMGAEDWRGLEFSATKSVPKSNLIWFSAVLVWQGSSLERIYKDLQKTKIIIMNLIEKKDEISPV